jgi:WD40 repeat protein
MAASTPGSQAAAGRPATAVAFSPDGRTLATAIDGTVRLWGAATQQEIGTPMTAGPASLYAVAFSPDGRTLATIGGGTARSWDVAFPAGLLAGACAIADQTLTRQHWAGYAGTQPFQQVCPAS